MQQPKTDELGLTFLDKVLLTAMLSLALAFMVLGVATFFNALVMVLG